MSARILWTHVVPAFMGDARITSSARVSSASNASAASSLKKGGTGRSFQRRPQAWSLLTLALSAATVVKLPSSVSSSLDWKRPMLAGWLEGTASRRRGESGQPFCCELVIVESV